MPTQYFDPDVEEEEDDEQPNYLSAPAIAAPPMGVDADQEEEGLPADAPQAAPTVVQPIPSGANSPIDDGTMPSVPSVASAPQTNQSLLDDEGQATGPAPVAAIALSPAETARKKVADLEGQRPVRPKVGWLRTLASIGAGLGAGYANASGKKLPQVDVSQLMDNIKYGGYNNKIADWQNQVADADAQANALEASQSKSAELANKTASTAHLNAETAGLTAPASPDVYHQRATAATSILGLKPGTPEYQEFVGTGSFKTADGHDYELTPDGKGGMVIFDKKQGTSKPAPGISAPAPKTTGPFEANQAAWQAANPGKQPTPDVVASWDKPKPISDDEFAAIVAGIPVSNPSAKGVTPQQARAALDAKKVNPFRGEAASERQAKEQAISNAFNDSGNDWNKVMENVRAGKYQNFSADIADHADKMSKLSTDAQRKVALAASTQDQVQKAIDAINEVATAHPDLVGNAGSHPINTVKRLYETHVGSEPSDIGATDTLLETIAAMQPGQHGMRSIGALADFKKALGVDPRTGKADGSRAWLVNPPKTIAALKQISDFNEELKNNTLKAAGRGNTGNSNRPSLDQLIPLSH